MTPLEWQKVWQVKLDSYFPFGTNVTMVTDVPEGDDNITLICPRMLVVDVRLDLPTLMSFPLGFGGQKDLMIEVESVLEDRQAYLELQDTSDTTWILTGNIQPGARADLLRMTEGDAEFTPPGVAEAPHEEVA